MLTEVGVTQRGKALRELEILYNPQCGGYAAGAGRYDAVFPRDLAITAKLILHRFRRLQSPILKSPGLQAEIQTFAQRAEKALDTIVMLQGKDPSPDQPLNEERKGKILHEWRNGFTSHERLLQLKLTGWPVVTKEDGSMEMLYFGAGDTTSRFITTVAILARFKGATEAPQEQERYIHRMWPMLQAAYNHEIELADTSGYHLIDSTPQNIYALLNHTEKDSDSSYITEEGLTPRPPYVFLSNNCHYLEALAEVTWMAESKGERIVTEDAKSRYKQGVEDLHRLFWMEDRQYFSPLIDGEGHQVKIINDDVLDGLWCGVFKPVYADKVIARLLGPDMLTPWGIRSRSEHSDRFRVNGAEAYWNGAVWIHRQAIAAIGFEDYNHTDAASILDERLERLVAAKGRVELVCVDRRGNLLDYREHGKAAACNPQLFAVGAVLARTS